jgi:hypothetical protein
VAWAAVLLGGTYALRARGATGLSIANLAACAVHLAASLFCAWAVLRRVGRGASLAAIAPEAVAEEQLHA